MDETLLFAFVRLRKRLVLKESVDYLINKVKSVEL